MPSNTRSTTTNPPVQYTSMRGFGHDNARIVEAVLSIVALTPTLEVACARGQSVKVLADHLRRVYHWPLTGPESPPRGLGRVFFTMTQSRPDLIHRTSTSRNNPSYGITTLAATTVVKETGAPKASVTKTPEPSATKLITSDEVANMIATAVAPLKEELAAMKKVFSAIAQIIDPQ